MRAGAVKLETVTCQDCRHLEPLTDDGILNDEVGECQAFAQFRSIHLVRRCCQFEKLQRKVEPLRRWGE